MPFYIPCTACRPHLPKAWVNWTNKEALDEARKKKQLQKLKQQKKVNRARAKIRKRRQRDMKKPTATDSAAVFEECKSSFEKIIGTGVSDAKIRFCLEKTGYDPMKAVQFYFLHFKRPYRRVEKLPVGEMPINGILFTQKPHQPTIISSK